MISNSQAGLLRRGKADVDPDDRDRAADLAVLERQGFVQVAPAVSGPMSYWTTDLGHAALLSFDRAARTAVAEKSLGHRIRRAPKRIWALANTPVIAGIIGAIIGFALGKFF